MILNEVRANLVHGKNPVHLAGEIYQTTLQLVIQRTVAIFGQGKR
ncbi:MAG: hypothetical protein U9P07_06730 [Pseudomonadota bacterium]|nr:hypothetical protein [Pseudomonadota bacterium]